MTPKTRMDYIELYAKSLREDNSLFRQHKKLIDSQIHGSVILFRRKFGVGESFKENARNYLRELGILK